MTRAGAGLLVTLTGAWAMPFAVGCGASKRQAVAPSQPAKAPAARAKRDKTTVPERLAALPGADDESEPENLERRFGREEAARRRDRQVAAGADGTVLGLVDQRAVQSACRDVPAADQTRCPLEVHRATVGVDRPEGISLTMAAGPSAGQIRDAVACYQARRGRGADDGPCPFDARGAQAKVTEAGGGVVLEISVDRARAGLIRERARRYLVPPAD